MTSKCNQNMIWKFIIYYADHVRVYIKAYFPPKTFLNTHVILRPCVLVLCHRSPPKFNSNNQERKYCGCMKWSRCVLDIDHATAAEAPRVRSSTLVCRGRRSRELKSCLRLQKQPKSPAVMSPRSSGRGLFHSQAGCIPKPPWFDRCDKCAPSSKKHTQLQQKIQ